MALDNSWDVLRVCIDLKKAFDLVNRLLLLEKISHSGIRGRALDWLKSYLSDRKQVVEITFIDGSYVRKAYSDILNVIFGIPQGSVLGPFLFILFINDIGFRFCIINGRLCLFVDDTSFAITAKNEEELLKNIFVQGAELFQWFKDNGLVVNLNKTNFMRFSIRGNHNNVASILLGDSEIFPKDCVTFLGLELDCNLKFSCHLKKLSKKLSSFIFALRNLSQYCSRDVLRIAYFGCFYANLAYAVPIWGSESAETKYIFSLQKRAMRIIFGLKKRQTCRGLFKSNAMLTFPCIYIFETLMFFKKNQNLFQNTRTGYVTNSLRPRNSLPIPRHFTDFFERNTKYACIKLYNSLPTFLKDISSVTKFRSKLKQYLIDNEFYSVQDYVLCNT